MSTFLRHEPCPSCGSRDNLGVWDDGHKWCFGCGHFIPGDGWDTAEIKRKIKLTPKSSLEEDSLSVNLPFDATASLPKFATNFLTGYGIYSSDWFRFGIKWSQNANALIFPVYNNNEKVCLYQLRSFLPHTPKWMTIGKVAEVCSVFKPTESVIQIDKDLVVIVEDFLSAIKVAKVANAVPLFGASLAQKKAVHLAKKFDKLIIWLDADKYGKAVEYKERYQSLFKFVYVIRSHKDPKDYMEYQISSNIKYELKDTLALDS